MTSGARVPSKYIFAALYATALFIIADQLSELVVALYPFNYGDVNWRFGAFGLATGRATTFVLVDGFVLIAALGRGHVGFIRFWGALHVLVAAALVAALVVFALDAVEIRQLVNPEGRSGVQVVSARAAVMAVSAAIFCTWLGVAGIRAAQSSKSRPDQAGVVVTKVGA